jgi:site-specific DNA-methyltransferase (adenine-specific)
MRHRVDRIVHGDCLDVLRTYADCTFDSLVTDPPAGIGFRKSWDTFQGRADFVAFLTPIMSECLRVLKPGAHGVVWALPRTAGWTSTAIEDAGFVILDSVHHALSNGYPKSQASIKPGHEVWWLVRKQFDETTERRGLNVEGCRLPSGRRPSTFLLSHSSGCRDGACDPKCAVAVLDRQSGLSTSRRSKPRSLRAGVGWGMTRTGAEYNDSGGASRFFQCFDSDDDLGIEVPFLYTKKASSRERFVCLTCACGAPPKVIPVASLRADQVHMCEACLEPLKHARHPTQKPLALMRWLVRLVTPKTEMGYVGTVLDPFLGSGTTAVAARLEGLHCVGIERDTAYVAIAMARLQTLKG